MAIRHPRALILTAKIRQPRTIEVLVDLLSRYCNRTDLLVDLDYAARQIARGLARPQPRRSVSSRDRVGRQWSLQDRLGEELIRDLVQGRLAGVSQKETAEKYGISESSVKRIMRLRRTATKIIDLDNPNQAGDKGR